MSALIPKADIADAIFVLGSALNDSPADKTLTYVK
jgi:hypothetical protein